MTTIRLVTTAALLVVVGCATPAEQTAPAAAPTAALPSDGAADPVRGPEDASAVAVGSRRDPTPADGERAGRQKSQRPARQIAEPVAVEIPAIGVAADVIDLGLNDDLTLEVPSDFDVAGWYTGRPPPGAVGPAIIVGHVDSRDGPAVFYRLRELAPGDEVLVRREDATTARFTVDRVEQHAKDDFPTAAVYGSTDEKALRLITCGGTFDRGRRSYDDNIVVFASLAA
jgi:sortase (surface protein transpeptidase)